jgi:hypothetical protein
VVVCGELAEMPMPINQLCEEKHFYGHDLRRYIQSANILSSF